MSFTGFKKAKKIQERKNIAAIPFHYDSYDLLPKKTFVRIMESGNIQLLSNQETDLSVLAEIWESIYTVFIDKEQTPDSKKIFRISKDIDVAESKHWQVLSCVESLRFDLNDELISLVKNYGYRIKTENNSEYHASLDKTEREAQSYILKAKQLKRLLPKVDEVTHKHTIDDVMASYSVILGIGFDFNKITCSEFDGYAKQVDLKIKALDAQTEKSKKK